MGMKRDNSKAVAVLKLLKSEILAGRHPLGKRFPSETALARRFNVSRSLVSQVVGELERLGLVTRRQGSGTFVSKFGARRRIGLMLSGLTYSEYFQPMATAFMHLAREAGYSLSFSSIRSSRPEIRVCEAREIVAEFIREHVAGVIYHPLDYAFDNGRANRRILSALGKAGIPVVLFDSDIEVAPSHSGYDVVSIDNVLAGETLARHLLDAGARNIHFLLKPNWMPNAQNRIRGVVCAVSQAGYRWNSSNVLVADPTDRVSIARHLRRHPRPDAFICENDNIAAEFLLTLKKLGVAVPQKLLLAGFDDVNVARLLCPPMTSVHQPCEEIAAAAFRRILARIVEPALPPQEIYIRAPLTVRESTRFEGTALKRKE